MPVGRSSSSIKPQSNTVSIDKTGLNIGVLQIELQDGRASKIMDDILEARMGRDQNNDSGSKLQKTNNFFLFEDFDF